MTLVKGSHPNISVSQLLIHLSRWWSWLEWNILHHHTTHLIFTRERERSFIQHLPASKPKQKIWKKNLPHNLFGYLLTQITEAVFVDVLKLEPLSERKNSPWRIGSKVLATIERVPIWERLRHRRRCVGECTRAVWHNTNHLLERGDTLQLPRSHRSELLFCHDCPGTSISLVCVISIRSWWKRTRIAGGCWCENCALHYYLLHLILRTRWWCGSNGLPCAV